MAENVGKISRCASRRLLLAASGLMVSVLVILGKIAPEQTDSTVQVIVGAAVLVLNVVGYTATTPPPGNERQRVCTSWARTRTATWRPWP